MNSQAVRLEEPGWWYTLWTASWGWERIRSTLIHRSHRRLIPIASRHRDVCVCWYCYSSSSNGDRVRSQCSNKYSERSMNIICNWILQSSFYFSYSKRIADLMRSAKSLKHLNLSNNKSALTANVLRCQSRPHYRSIRLKITYYKDHRSIYDCTIYRYLHKDDTWMVSSRRRFGRFKKAWHRVVGPNVL